MVLAIANITRRIARQQYKKAFLSSAVVISLLLIVTAVELDPDLVISGLNKEYNPTVANAASSQMSLHILLTIAAGIKIPLMIFYAVFVYKAFSGKLKWGRTKFSVKVTISFLLNNTRIRFI